MEQIYYAKVICLNPEELANQAPGDEADDILAEEVENFGFEPVYIVGREECAVEGFLAIEGDTSPQEQHKQLVEYLGELPGYKPKIKTIWVDINKAPRIEVE